MGNDMLVPKATGLELIKIFSKWRTYIGFATVAVLIPLIMWLVRKYGFGIENQALRSLGIRLNLSVPWPTACWFPIT